MQNLDFYLDQMYHRVGKNAAKWDSRVDPVALFNMAGRELLSKRRWSFLATSTTIVGVADQNYILLPEDFESLESAVVEGSGLGLGSIELRTPEVIAKLRQAQAGTQRYGFVAAVGGSQSQASPTVPARRKLELWPTPDTDGTPSITLQYRRGWVDFASTGDGLKVPNLPSTFHNALTLGCRVFAHEYLSPEIPASDRPRYEQAVLELWEADEDQQTDMGVPIGGVRRDTDDCLPRFPIIIGS